MEGNVLQGAYPDRPEKKGISGSTLKLVAIITMLIDHTAATIIDNTLTQRELNNLNAGNVHAAQKYLIDSRLLTDIDMFMRLVGRLAFPIFCFLLVEGMVHTHNKLKYAMRMAVFALVSEIPFDLAFHGRPFYWESQNVFFTLLIGLLVMIGFYMVHERLKDMQWLTATAIAGALAAAATASYLSSRVIGMINVVLSISGAGINSMIRISRTFDTLLFVIFGIAALLVYAIMCRKSLLQKANIIFTDLAVLSAGIMLAQLMHTDYAGFGVLTMAIMYGLRENHFKTMLGGCITLTVMSFMEFTCFFDLLLIRKYNGRRGMNLKYVFYLFYPVHLTILYLICYFMKIV